LNVLLLVTLIVFLILLPSTGLALWVEARLRKRNS
jgi:hypothetical protein